VGVSPLTRGKRAVFLDRDGVVNQAILRDGKPFPPADVSGLVINPDAIAGLPLLKRLGFLLVVVTNQPDVGRGRTSMDAVREIHNAIRSELPIDDFFVCCHDDRDRCDCRKPLPGLLLRAAEQYEIQLEDSFLIGDRWRDIDAGYQAGVHTALIDYGYEERGPDHEPDIRVKSLSQAVQWVTTWITTK
jgi:D-glycero-D-manno-heptose 1,7-bisphosphate phosphatase